MEIDEDAFKKARNDFDLTEAHYLRKFLQRYLTAAVHKCDENPNHYGQLVHRQFHDQVVEKLTSERDAALLAQRQQPPRAGISPQWALVQMAGMGFVNSQGRDAYDFLQECFKRMEAYEQAGPSEEAGPDAGQLVASLDAALREALSERNAALEKVSGHEALSLAMRQRIAKIAEDIRGMMANGPPWTERDGELSDLACQLEAAVDAVLAQRQQPPQAVWTREATEQFAYQYGGEGATEEQIERLYQAGLKVFGSVCPSVPQNGYDSIAHEATARAAEALTAERDTALRDLAKARQESTGWQNEAAALEQQLKRACAKAERDLAEARELLAAYVAATGCETPELAVDQRTTSRRVRAELEEKLAAKEADVSFEKERADAAGRVASEALSKQHDAERALTDTKSRFQALWEVCVCLVDALSDFNIRHAHEPSPLTIRQRLEAALAKTAEPASPPVERIGGCALCTESLCPHHTVPQPVEPAKPCGALCGAHPTCPHVEFAKSQVTLETLAAQVARNERALRNLWCRCTNGRYEDSASALELDTDHAADAGKGNDGAGRAEKAPEGTATRPAKG